MIWFEKHNIDPEDTIKTISFINKYFETNKCCEEHPKCEHPKSQTDNMLFNNEEVGVFRNSFYKALKSFLKKDYQLVYEKAWSYFATELNDFTWHDHVNNRGTNIEKIEEYSGIIYLNHSNRGTLFEDDNFFWSIKPKINHWYIWPSHLQHTPQLGKTENMRYVIATAVGVKVALK
jgi:hypothetical protein